MGFHRRLLISRTRQITSWRWRSVANFTMAEYGDPLHTTGYSLCVYAGPEATLVESLHADPGGTCAGKACWQRRDSKSFLFKDHNGAQSGVKRIVLRAGMPALADLVVRARGPNVPLPALPLSAPVVAQMVKSDGSACWESDYSAPPLRNKPEVFADRND